MESQSSPTPPVHKLNLRCSYGHSTVIQTWVLLFIASLYKKRLGSLLEGEQEIQQQWDAGMLSEVISFILGVIKHVKVLTLYHYFDAYFKSNTINISNKINVPAKVLNPVTHGHRSTVLIYFFSRATHKDAKRVRTLDNFDYVCSWRQLCSSKKSSNFPISLYSGGIKLLPTLHRQKPLNNPFMYGHTINTEHYNKRLIMERKKGTKMIFDYQCTNGRTRVPFGTGAPGAKSLQECLCTVYCALQEEAERFTKYHQIYVISLVVHRWKGQQDTIRMPFGCQCAKGKGRPVQQMYQLTVSVPIGKRRTMEVCHLADCMQMEEAVRQTGWLV